MLKLLTGAHLFLLLDPDHPGSFEMKSEDDHENVLFSIKVTVGVENETYIEGGTIYPFGPLNEYNSRKNRGADKHDSE